MTNLIDINKLIKELYTEIRKSAYCNLSDSNVEEYCDANCIHCNQYVSSLKDINSIFNTYLNMNIYSAKKND